MMNKQKYQKPNSIIFHTEPEPMLVESVVTGIASTDTGIGFGGTGSGPLRSRSCWDFDEDEEDEE